jgi:HEAT repeat protein
MANKNPSPATRFKPGVSGNPGGRPKGIAAKAREHTGRVIEVLVEALEDKDARVRIQAAKELLDRGYGRPLTMTADVSNSLDDFNDDQLSEAISALRQFISEETAGEAGKGADEATKH